MTSIRRKIIVNTVAIIVILALVVVGILLATTSYMTDSILTNVLKPLVRTASQTVEGNLHLLADRIYLISDNPQFTDPGSTKADHQALLARAASGIEFVSLSMYTLDGKLYLGEGTPAADISGGSLYQQMRDTGYLVIDDTRRGTDGSLEIAIGTPVLDSGGEQVYYLVGNYKYDVLNDVMTNINLGHTGRAFIFNQQGVLMASPEKNKVLDINVFTDLSDSKELVDILTRASSGEIGALCVDAYGEPNYVAYAPVRGTNWTIGIIVPRGDFTAVGNTAILWTVLTVAVMLAAAILLISRFSKRISRSLGNVTGRIQKLAQGDLSSPVEVISTRDEAETLSIALRDTVGDINSYLGELRDALSQVSDGDLDVAITGDFQGDFIVMKNSLNHIIGFLNDVMEELRNASQQLLAASRGVADSSQLVSTSSESQAASVTRLISQSDTISQNIRTVDSNARKAEELMIRVNEQLAQGDAQMQEMVRTMDQINENAREISKIAKLMEDIAFQTNILALNASVEAAHAGSAGKGFSVVAEQVRLLAEKSSQSSQKASEMLEHSQEQVAQGVDFAHQTARTMGKIAGISEEISGIVNGLASSVHEQKDALEEMVNDINEISSLSDQNLAASAQSASASREMTQQAEALQDISGQFRLRSSSSKVLVQGRDRG